MKLQSSKDYSVSPWNVTSGTQCVGCGTTRYVFYCYTSLEGKTWESCEDCLDKVEVIRDEYFRGKDAS
tara:strand:+ start:407 stop:610 length:204 start_codon:yes stop_codon:yes gene_type:complete